MNSDQRLKDNIKYIFQFLIGKLWIQAGSVLLLLIVHFNSLFTLKYERIKKMRFQFLIGKLWMSPLITTPVPQTGFQFLIGKLWMAIFRTNRSIQANFNSL